MLKQRWNKISSNFMYVKVYLIFSSIKVKKRDRIYARSGFILAGWYPYTWCNWGKCTIVSSRNTFPINLIHNFNKYQHLNELCFAPFVILIDAKKVHFKVYTYILAKKYDEVIKFYEENKMKIQVQRKQGLI